MVPATFFANGNIFIKRGLTWWDLIRLSLILLPLLCIHSCAFSVCLYSASLSLILAADHHSWDMGKYPKCACGCVCVCVRSCANLNLLNCSTDWPWASLCRWVVAYRHTDKSISFIGASNLYTAITVYCKPNCSCRVSYTFNHCPLEVSLCIYTYSISVRM